MRNRYFGFCDFMSILTLLFVVLVVSLFAYGSPLHTGMPSVGQSEIETYGNAPTQAFGNEVHPPGVNDTTMTKVQETYGKLPLYFIQNDGQLNGKVKFYEKGSGHAMFFTKRGVFLSLVNRKLGEENLNPNNNFQSKQSEIHNPKSEIIKLIPLGGSKSPEIIAEGIQQGKVNYFIGNDAKKWKTNIPTYQAVVYKDIYKDIDMKFYGNNRQLEYDIIVKPGANPYRVQLSYQGIDGLKVTEEGNLVISLKDGKVIQKKPYVYQEINGKKVEIDGKFRVQNSKLKTQNTPFTVFRLPLITSDTHLLLTLFFSIRPFSAGVTMMRVVTLL